VEYRFRVTYGHFQPHDVVSFHVTATSCKLQPCRSRNAPKTRVFGLLQPSPGHFRWKDIPSRSLLVCSGHVTSFCHVTANTRELQPCRGWNTAKMFLAFYSFSRPLLVKWGHFWVTSNHFWYNPSFYLTWLQHPASYSPVGAEVHLKRAFLASTVFSSPLPEKWRHFCSLMARWCCHVPPPPASYSSVGAEAHPKHELSAFYSLPHATSGEMTSLPWQFPSLPDAWHLLHSRDCHFLQVSAL